MSDFSNYPVLFTCSNSNYLKFGCNCFDIKRDALSFTFHIPAIYHPPCASWSRLRHFSKFVPGRHWLAIWSLIRVRRYGGIIEHPYSSLFFKKYIIAPGAGYDEFGGFTILTDLHSFGSPVDKKTLLYFVGCRLSDLPPLPMNFDVISHCVCSSKKDSNLKELSRNARSVTPYLMCEYLLKCLDIIYSKKSESLSVWEIIKSYSI